MVMPLGHRVPLAVRIAKHHRRAPNGCLLWTSYVSRRGLPYMRVNGEMRRVSRVIWEAANGPIPDGLLVRHSCDDPLCGELTHLLLGTDQDNSDDKLSRGRGAKGSTHGNAKLTESQIRAIRNGPVPTDRRAAAHALGVSTSLHCQIQRGIGWAHVP